MISYLKFLLIFSVLALHLSNASPVIDIDKQLENVGSEVDSLLSEVDDDEEEGQSPKAKTKEAKGKKAPAKEKKPTKKAQPTKIKTTTSIPTPVPTPVPTTEETSRTPKTEAAEGSEGTTQLPDTVTDHKGNVGLRKEDIKFLEGIYSGKNKETYKKMSDLIFKTLENNVKRVNEQLKDNILFKAYVKNAHNISEGIQNLYHVMKSKDLSTFLHDWYKMEHKPQKGEIKEVEEAVKAHEEDARTAPPPNETTKGQEPDIQEEGTSVKPLEEGVNTTPLPIKIGSIKTTMAQNKKEEKKKQAKELNKAAKKVGVKPYYKGQLLKDLVKEHQKGAAQHTDVLPIGR